MGRAHNRRNEIANLKRGEPVDEFLIADCGIRQLHARFTDAVWRQDADEFSGCFTTDGE
jgi:hypothetical protein